MNIYVPSGLAENGAYLLVLLFVPLIGIFSAIVFWVLGTDHILKVTGILNHRAGFLTLMIDLIVAEILVLFWNLGTVQHFILENAGPEWAWWTLIALLALFFNIIITKGLAEIERRWRESKMVYWPYRPE